MAAGSGFKTFNTGDVLSASDVNGYLMQGIWVFATAAARNAAVTSPQEGNACYLKDTDVVQIYDGSTWVTQSANNAISANIVDAKGDIIAATADNTVARVAVGTNGQVLTADSTATAGIKWAAAASGTPTFVGCSLSKSASQSISNATFTAITFDVEQFDTDAFHSTSSNTSRITIPSGKAGKYQINGGIQYANTTGGIRYAAIYKNNAEYWRNATAAPSNDGRINTPINIIMDLAVGDYIEIYAYQSSGGALNVNWNQEGTYCTNFMIGLLGV